MKKVFRFVIFTLIFVLILGMTQAYGATIEVETGTSVYIENSYTDEIDVFMHEGKMYAPIEDLAELWYGIYEYNPEFKEINLGNKNDYPIIRFPELKKGRVIPKMELDINTIIPGIHVLEDEFYRLSDICMYLEKEYTLDNGYNYRALITLTDNYNGLKFSKFLYPSLEIEHVKTLYFDANEMLEDFAQGKYVKYIHKSTVEELIKLFKED